MSIGFIGGPSHEQVSQYLRRGAAASSGTQVNDVGAAQAPFKAQGGGMPLLGIGRALSADELQESGMADRLASMRDVLDLQEYEETFRSAREAQFANGQAVFDRLNKDLGGLLSGAAVPNNLFGGDPVRTSSGAIHPQSDRILSYLRDHQQEWRSVYSDSVPSFEQWRQQRG